MSAPEYSDVMHDEDDDDDFEDEVGECPMGSAVKSRYVGMHARDDVDSESDSDDEDDEEWEQAKMLARVRAKSSSAALRVKVKNDKKFLELLDEDLGIFPEDDAGKAAKILFWGEVPNPTATAGIVALNKLRKGETPTKKERGFVKDALSLRWATRVVDKVMEYIKKPWEGANVVEDLAEFFDTKARDPLAKYTYALSASGFALDSPEVKNAKDVLILRLRKIWDDMESETGKRKRTGEEEEAPKLKSKRKEKRRKPETEMTVKEVEEEVEEREEPLILPPSDPGYEPSPIEKLFVELERMEVELSRKIKKFNADEDAAEAKAEEMSRKSGKPVEPKRPLIAGIGEKEYVERTEATVRNYLDLLKAIIMEAFPKEYDNFINDLRTKGLEYVIDRWRNDRLGDRDAFGFDSAPGNFESMQDDNRGIGDYADRERVSELLAEMRELEVRLHIEIMEPGSTVPPINLLPLARKYERVLKKLAGVDKTEIGRPIQYWEIRRRLAAMYIGYEMLKPQKIAGLIRVIIPFSPTKIERIRKGIRKQAEKMEDEPTEPAKKAPVVFKSEDEEIKSLAADLEELKVAGIALSGELVRLGQLIGTLSDKSAVDSTYAAIERLKAKIDEVKAAGGGKKMKMASLAAARDERIKREEAERVARAAEAERKAREAEEARKAEIERKAREAEEARKAEVARRAKEAEDARLAKEAEVARLAKEAEEARKAKLEAERLAKEAEVARKAKEAEELRKKVEEATKMVAAIKPGDFDW